MPQCQMHGFESVGREMHFRLNSTVREILRDKAEHIVMYSVHVNHPGDIQIQALASQCFAMGLTAVAKALNPAQLPAFQCLSWAKNLRDCLKVYEIKKQFKVSLTKQSYALTHID